MLPNRFMITGIVVLVAIIGAVWYVGSLKDTIQDQKDHIVLIQKEKSNLEVESALKSADISKLESVIQDQNMEIMKFASNEDKIKAELEIWKNQPIKVKYKDRIVEKIITKTLKPSDDICKDFIEITNDIKELRYEDL